MQYFLYAVSNELPWLELDEIGPEHAVEPWSLPAVFQEREEIFLTIAERFLDFFDGPAPMEYRYMKIFDDFPKRRDPKRPPALYNTLGWDEREIERIISVPRFSDLERSEKMLMLKMTSRDIVRANIGNADGVRLQLTDTFFYWEVALPDNFDPQRLAWRTEIRAIPTHPPGV